MRVLVTGGAGYIGSHVVRMLVDRGHDVMVVDDLSTGHADAVATGCGLLVGNLCDRAFVHDAFDKFRPAAVMHFAAKALVGQSTRDPWLYFHDNIVSALYLVEAARLHGSPPIVFSSTCAIYGHTDLNHPINRWNHGRIDEDQPRQPINPYGESKLCIERMLAACDRAHGLRYVALRYFNAAGAAPEWELGERHDPETHLIPLLLNVAALELPAARIFGLGHMTPDGSCVRDYIHVLDLADAHLLALDHLAAGKPSVAVNLGTGTGASVIEVLRIARKVTGHPIPAVTVDPRPGDPDTLVADSRYAEEVLGWKAKRGLHEMVESAWRFMRDRRCAM